MECIPGTDTEELIWLLLIGPKPSEGAMPGEPSEGLMTEKGEPKMVVGLLEAELMGCCEDMAIKLPSAEEEDLSEDLRRQGETRGETQGGGTRGETRGETR